MKTFRRKTTKTAGLICMLVAQALWVQLPHALAQQAQAPDAINSYSESTSPVAGSRDGKAASKHGNQEHDLVAVANGRLTVHVQSRPLNGVLQQISAESGVLIDARYVLGASVTADLQSIPLEEGLRLLLAGQDFFVLYGGTERKQDGEAGRRNASVRAIWVYPRGKGYLVYPVPPEQWASTSDLKKSLYTSDPEQRARAAEILIGRGGQQGLEIALQALKDPEDRVRYRSLDKARQSGITLSTESLQDVVRSDASPLVRSIALGIAENSDPEVARLIAECAQNDADQGIQIQAQKILGELDAASHPPAPDASQEPGPGREADGDH
jgi:hypothetical protein